MSTSYIKDVSQYITQMQNESNKEDQSEWVRIEELYNKKLWHQLTFKILSYVKNPDHQRNGKLLDLYNSFLSIFETRINPLSLVEIIAFVIPEFTDANAAVEFLKKTEEKVKINPEAVALCKVLAGRILLEHLNDNAATKTIINDVEKILDDLEGVTTVHGRHYLLAAQYYKKLGQHADYYRTALRYLGCVDLDQLSIAEQQEHALYLGLAALLGEKVYNIGELLTHPVLQTLKSSPNEWLVDLLFAFNSGDISKFDKMKPQWMVVPDLLLHERKLRQKISLLCLMEMTFNRTTSKRELNFTEIASETRLPVEEVELLVMKALAQGLVRGQIDQLSQVVTMTWVQPRVLDKPQIKGMEKRLDDWIKDVEVMESLMEDKGREFLQI